MIRVFKGLAMAILLQGSIVFLAFIGLGGVAGAELAANESIAYQPQQEQLQGIIVNASSSVHANASGISDAAISLTVDPIMNMGSHGLSIGYRAGYHIPYFEYLAPVIMFGTFVGVFAYKIQKVLP